MPNLRIYDYGPTLESTFIHRAKMYFKVLLDAPATTDVRFSYKTINGTALAGSDYDSATGTLTIPRGRTETGIWVYPKGDDLVESDERFYVKIFGVTGAIVVDDTAIGIIRNTPYYPPRLTVRDAGLVNEGASARFLITLDRAATSAVNFTYNTANGNGNAGADYTARSGTATIAVGQTSVYVDVRVLADSIAEPDERFYLNVSSVSGAMVADSQGLATIRSVTPDNAGNTLSGARTVTLGTSSQTWNDWVGSTDTNDYYRFSLSAASNFRLTLSGLSANANVQLLNSSGGVITSSLNTGSASEAISRDALAAGTYYIRVYPDASPANTYYNLSMSATPSAALPHYVAALLPPEKPRWGSGSGATITYAFAQNMPAYDGDSTRAAGFRAFSETDKSATRQILAQYSDILNVRFNEVAAPEQSQLSFGGNSRLGSGIGGYAFYPGTGTGTVAGDVWMATSTLDNGERLVRGSWTYGALVHEIGHALGLKHPGNYPAGAGTPPPYLPTPEDNKKYTIMSYSSDPDARSVDFNYDGWYYSLVPSGPMLYDVAALQYLYGANTGSHSGSDVYRFDAQNAPITTIWDAAGSDTLDATGYTSPVTLNLNPGAFSSIGGTKNIAIAYGVTIENAAGGTTGDIITGNAVANRITGNRGSDTLTGGAGADVFVFNSRYDGTDTITDFHPGEDKLAFLSTSFGALPTGRVSASNFALNGPIDADDFFVFNSSSSLLTFDADGIGTGTAVSVARLSGITSLAFNDLQIVTA